MNSGLDQAIVLATRDEAPPSIVPRGIEFLNLIEGAWSDRSLVSSVRDVSIANEVED
jgi:hypothetical protein